MKCSLFIAIAAVVCLAGCKPEWERTGRLVLAERGRPARYEIVLPAAPSPSQVTAARELQHHVERMTGVSLPVATNTSPAYGIFLGNGAADLGNDGFRIVARPPHLRIEGGRVHGTLFGVNDFLERHCGCEWFSSTTIEIPRLDRLDVSATLDETRMPAFRFRDANWWEQQHDFAFAARMKMNGFRTEYPEEYGGMDLKMDTSTGGATFNALVPPSKYFKEHPEWFALVDGHRKGERSQLCLTNPGLIDFLTSNVLARIAKHYPAAKYYGINPNDWRQFCRCKACGEINTREGTQMGTLLALVNTVAERVEKRYPDVVIHTLAYLYTLKPPKTIRPRNNVMITYCTDQCDFSKPIAKSRWKGSKEFVEDYAGWGGICRNLYIWDYSANFQYLPMAFECVHVMPENFRLFKEGGAVGVFEEGHHVGSRGADAQLKLWVLAHLAWDPYQPLEPLLQRFFKGYYGAAADTARAYYDALVAAENSRNEEKAPLSMWGRLEDESLPVEFFDHWSAEWEKALARVADDPIRAENVRWALNQVDWVRILLANAASKVVLSRQPGRAMRRIAALKKAALRLEADLAKEPTARNVSGFTKMSNARIKSVATFDPAAFAAADRVVVEDSALEAAAQFGATRVKDPKAEDGSAIRIDPYAKGWYQSVLIRSRDMITDPGVPLRIRARIRVEKTGIPGEAFTSGTCNNSNFKKRQIKSFAVQTKNIADGEYHWYDIEGTWTPEPGEVYWIGMGRYDKPKHGRNRAVDGVYVDKIEIRRAELVENGDFEDRTSSAWKLPGDGAWKIEEDVGRNGSRAMVWQTDKGLPFRYPKQNLNGFRTGREYRFGGWIKPERLDMSVKDIKYRIDVGWRSPTNRLGGAGATVVADNDTTTGGWLKFEGKTRYLDGDATSMEMIFYVCRQATGRVLFDDLWIEECPYEPVGRLCTSAYRETAEKGPVTIVAPLRFDAKAHSHETLSATFEITGPDGARRTIPADSVDSEKASVTVDVSSLAFGTNPISCTLKTKDGDTVGTRSIDFTRERAHRPRKVEIDAHRRFLVDGKPFFPFGLYTKKMDEEELSIYCEAPFNALQNYLPLETRHLDLIHARGLKVMYSVMAYYYGIHQCPKRLSSEKAADDYVAGLVNAHKGHPALLGWYNNDEIPVRMVPKLEERYSMIRRLDPEHPVWTCLDRPLNIREYLASFDVIGSDPYPIGQASAVYRHLDLPTEWTRLTDNAVFGLKPILQVPQAFNWGWFHGSAGKVPDERYPTLDELRNMWWQQVAAGANGLLGYAFHPMRRIMTNGTYRVEWEKVVTMAKEMRPFLDTFLSVEPAVVASGGGPQLPVRTWRAEGADWVLAVNASREPVKASLSLSVPFVRAGRAFGIAGRLENGGRALALDLPPMGVSFTRLER